jgi:signal transduction histidine kinase
LGQFGSGGRAPTPDGSGTSGMTSSRPNPLGGGARFTAHAIVLAVLLAAVALLVSIVPGVANERLSLYTYRDTRNLVSLVEDAARLMERKGEQAFREFAEQDSKWLNDDYYLFVYALDGTCMFHPVTPELIGKNVIDLKDMNGKPIVRQITDVGRKGENDASGWVFYLWQNQTQLIPSWKSAYVRKVVAPNGQTYVVGSGSYNIKVEKVFVEERVRMAADLLKSAGKAAAFEQFRDPASPFVFLESFIFVLNVQGHTLVDPAFPTMAGRDLSEFKDAVGFFAIREVLKKLAHADQAWVQYLWPKPGSSVTSRKLVHVRKVDIGGETLVVGSDFFLATPIWMKV